jgi:hypothetical protein
MKTTQVEKPVILKFIRDWFSQINNHGSVESLLAMLAPDGFMLQFPEATLNSEEAFRAWYQEVTSKYFDQNHDVKQLQIDRDEGGVEITLLVNWQAKTWESPAAYSTYLNFDAIQSWRIEALPRGHQPVIKRYTVVELIEN